MKLQATYTRDHGGMHARLSDIETQEIVHTITLPVGVLVGIPRFVKEVKSWAALNDHLIVEESLGGDLALVPLHNTAGRAAEALPTAWIGDACHE